MAKENKNVHELEQENPTGDDRRVRFRAFKHGDVDRMNKLLEKIDLINVIESKSSVILIYKERDDKE